jgi:hypothetical protein
MPRLDREAAQVAARVPHVGEHPERPVDMLAVLEHPVPEVDVGLGLVGEPLAVRVDHDRERVGPLADQERRVRVRRRCRDRRTPPRVVHQIDRRVDALAQLDRRHRGRRGLAEESPSMPWCSLRHSVRWANPPAASTTPRRASMRVVVAVAFDDGADHAVAVDHELRQR